MPPQQISPSAASRSPWSRAIAAARLRVSAIFFWLPPGSWPSLQEKRPSRSGRFHRDACPARAVSWRSGRPCESLSGSSRAGGRPPWPRHRTRQARPPSRRRTPCRRSWRRRLSAIVADIDVDVRVVEKDVDAFKLDPVNLAAAVRLSMVSRSIVGSAPGSLCRQCPATSRCGFWEMCSYGCHPWNPSI